MNPKKLMIIFAVVLVVIIGLLLLVSLFTNDDEPDDNVTPPTNNTNNNSNDPVTLEVWGLWESEAVMQPLIDKYQQQNPNVTIKYSRRSFAQYEENVYTRLQQGQSVGTPAPDIFRMNNTWLPRFQQYLSPMPIEVMSGSEYASTFYPTAVRDFTGTDNNLYAIPLEIDGLTLFYNKEIFAEAGITTPPKDWDEMIDIAKELTVKDSAGNITQAGLAMGTSNNVMHSADILSLLMLQNGAEINQDFNTKVDLTSTRAVDALTFYTDFYTVHEVWSPDLRSDLEMFFSGDLAMMFAPSWRAFDIINSNPSIEFGLAATPTLASDPIYYSMYWGEAVAKDSANPTEAWKFVKFLSEQSQLKEFYSNSVQIDGRAFGEPYSRVDMAAELQSNPYLKSIGDMAPNMVSWKMGIQSFTEQRLRNAIDDVVSEEATAATAMKTAQDEINEELSTIFVVE